MIKFGKEKKLKFDHSKEKASEACGIEGSEIRKLVDVVAERFGKEFEKGRILKQSEMVEIFEEIIEENPAFNRVASYMAFNKVTEMAESVMKKMLLATTLGDIIGGLKHN